LPLILHASPPRGETLESEYRVRHRDGQQGYIRLSHVFGL
jgi:hypothetical protein